MSLRKKIIAGVALAVVGYALFLGYRAVETLRHIPEAYAAWDTGTLLIEYMNANGRRWPSSWDDLLSVMYSEPGSRILLRGASAGDIKYAIALRRTVAINWQFDPTRMAPTSLVTRLDGTGFPTVWEGHEPNEMIRAYLTTPTHTNATPAH